MQEQLLSRTQKEQQQTEVLTRIETALDSTNVNIMMADNERNIIYWNRATQVMFKRNESAFQSVFPDFDAEDIVGKNIDIFHKNPAHQSKLLAELTDSYESDLSIGDRYFNLIANPIFNDKKERLGSVVEWSDTDRKSVV